MRREEAASLTAAVPAKGGKAPLLPALFLALLPAAVFSADQAAKKKSRSSWNKKTGGHSRRIGKKPLSVTLCCSRNEGAFLNFGESTPALVRLVSVCLTAVLSAVFVLTLGKAGKGLLKTGLALLLGGAFSNTYDRMRKKAVTDYLRFDFGPEKFRRIVFNLGDFAILIGALLSVLGSEE